MPARVIQNSFAGGELSPALYGRHDIEAYFKGAKKIENFVVQKTGGVKKRGGLKAGYLFDGDSAVIVPYRFTRTEGGVLIVTAGLVGGTLSNRVAYCRKNQDGTLAAPGAGAAGNLPEYIHLPSLTWEQVGDIVLLSGERPPYTGSNASSGPSAVAAVTVNHLSNTIAVAAYAVTPKPPPPYSLALSAQGETMIVSSGSVKARTLYYAAYTETGGVRSDPAKNEICNTNAEWPAGCSIQITARVHPSGGVYPDEIVFGKRSGALFGELARTPGADFTAEGLDGGQPYRSYVFTDENHLAGSAIYKQTALVAEGSNLAARCAGLYQQRLFFASLPGEPFSVLFSRAGDFRGFHADRPAADTDPFRLTLAADSPAVIRFAAAYRDSMLLFCDTGVWSVSGSSNDGFSARTCQVFQLTDIGCSPSVKPIKTTDGAVYVGADGRTVYELRYDLARDTVTPAERSVLSDHLTEGRSITSMTHQRYPASVIWFTLDDGTVLSFSYQPEHELYAWARHPNAAVASIGNLSRVLCPGTVTGPHSDLYALGSNAAWSGSFNPPALHPRLISRMDHGDPTDEGVPVRGEVVTLRPELPDRNVQGMQKNVVDCLVRVRGARRLAAGPEGGDLAQALDVAPADPAYTGNVKIMPRGSVNEDGRMSIVSDAGPCEIQCVVFKTEIHQ